MRPFVVWTITLTLLAPLLAAQWVAPQCKQDIDKFRRLLGIVAMNQGLAVWQGGNADSAVGLLRQAYAVDPSSPRPLFQLGSLYASRNAFDSASAVLHRAAQGAGDD